MILVQNQADKREEDNPQLPQSKGIHGLCHRATAGQPQRSEAERTEQTSHGSQYTEDGKEHGHRKSERSAAAESGGEHHHGAWQQVEGELLGLI